MSITGVLSQSLLLCWLGERHIQQVTHTINIITYEMPKIQSLVWSGVVDNLYHIASAFKAIIQVFSKLWN
jgi:hypothetical protein